MNTLKEEIAPLLTLIKALKTDPNNVQLQMQAKEKIDSIKLISERLALLTQPTIDDTINGKQEYLESMIREQQEHQSTKLAPITGPYQPEVYQAAKEISESLENTHVSPSSPEK